MAFAPILPKALKRAAAGDSKKVAKTEHPDKDIQPQTSVVKSDAEEKALCGSKNDEKISAAAQYPRAKTRRKKVVIAPNTKAKAPSKPRKKVAFAENSKIDTPDACGNIKALEADPTTPKPADESNSIVEAKLKPFGEQTSKAEVLVIPEPANDGSAADVDSASTEGGEPTVAITNELSGSIIDAPKYNSTGSTTKSAAKTISIKTREQIVKEQFGLEDKNIRQRNALKKLRNIEGLNNVESNKDWSHMVRDSLLVSDLIYCNPPKNAAKELGITITLRKMKEKAKRQKKTSALSNTVEEQLPIPEQPVPQDNTVIAPQIRLNEDGSVVLDEESLVINTSNADTVVHDTPAIYENSFSFVSHSNFRRFKSAKRSSWSEKQTQKFYDALRVVGADFSLMSAMFRNRNDVELRKKYNLERKKHSWKVDEALKHQHLSKWTNDMFMPDSSSDEESGRSNHNRDQTKKNSSKRKADASSDSEPTCKKSCLPNEVSVS